VWSCLECDRCKNDNEVSHAGLQASTETLAKNYCTQQVDTCKSHYVCPYTSNAQTDNAKYPNGEIAHGGYSSGIRAHERFTFKIPDALPLEQAASLLCAGVTTYFKSPFVALIFD
jgi:alcohol dehydrogenase (NADP+)